ncbi:MAG TPA: hypothetical protein VF953_00120 [Terriglobales bacterium]
MTKKPIWSIVATTGSRLTKKTVLDTIDALGGEPKQDDVLKRAGIKRANGIGVLKRLEQRGTILRSASRCRFGGSA